MDEDVRLQLGLVGAMLYLFGVCTGGIIYALLTQRWIDTLTTETIRARHKCESLALSLPRCDSR